MSYSPLAQKLLLLNAHGKTLEEFEHSSEYYNKTTGISMTVNWVRDSNEACVKRAIKMLERIVDQQDAIKRMIIEMGENHSNEEKQAEEMIKHAEGGTLDAPPGGSKDKEDGDADLTGGSATLADIDEWKDWVEENASEWEHNILPEIEIQVKEAATEKDTNPTEKQRGEQELQQEYQRQQHLWGDPLQDNYRIKAEMMGEWEDESF